MQTQLAQEKTSPEKEREEIFKYLKWTETYSMGCVSKYKELGDSLDELFGGLGELITLVSESEDIKKEIGEDFEGIHGKYISDSQNAYDNIGNCKQLYSDAREAVSYLSGKPATKKEAEEMENRFRELFEKVRENGKIVIENSRKLGFLLTPGKEFPEVYGKIAIRMDREKFQEISSRLDRCLKIVMKYYFVPTEEEIEKLAPKGT